MRELGIEGVGRRRKKGFTTLADPVATRAPDLANRQFAAEALDQLSVTNLTYGPPRPGPANLSRNAEEPRTEGGREIGSEALHHGRCGPWG